MTTANRQEATERSGPSAPPSAGPPTAGELLELLGETRGYIKAWGYPLVPQRRELLERIEGMMKRISQRHEGTVMLPAGASRHEGCHPQE